MANVTKQLIACNALGTGPTLEGASCCYTDNLSSAACQSIFSPSNGTLDQACLNPIPCGLDVCQNATAIYHSSLEDNLPKDGLMPLYRYTACVNLAGINNAQTQKLLPSNFSNVVDNFIGSTVVDNTTLQNVTAQVTSCLMATCENARDPLVCFPGPCSPTNLLVDSATPNITGINQCLYALCHFTESLPWADPDVVGIGMFTSYIMQCAYVVILWAGFVILALRHRSLASWPGSNATKWVDHLVDFHKSQCFFSATLMLAALVNGAASTDMLTTFLIAPLATNSILPVVFGYLLLYYYVGSSVGCAILTVIVYILATVAYLTLFAHLLRIIEAQVDKGLPLFAYEQFYEKLSAASACGGYSGLAVCPNLSSQDLSDLNTQDVKRPLLAEVNNTVHNIHYVTPFIWAFSTAVLLVLLGHQLFHWLMPRWRARRRQGATYDAVLAEGAAEKRLPFQTHRVSPWAFWAATAFFLAGIALQLLLFYDAVALRMFDRHHWTFGQIVAVTIWIPPLLEYLYSLTGSGEQPNGGKS